MTDPNLYRESAESLVVDLGGRRLGFRASLEGPRLAVLVARLLGVTPRVDGRPR